jgi:hypothetical protein
MNKTIKINDDYLISGRLIYDKENNKWYIEIYDNWQRIEKDSKFYEYENIDKAIDELKYCIKRNKNCKLWFSIMKYFMNKWYDLDNSRNNVYEINNNFDDLDCMIDDRINYIKNHNIKIVNHY